MDASWSAYFSGITLTAEPGWNTRLSAELADQSALYGLLNHVRDLNLRLISVQLLDSDGLTPVACRRCPKNKPLAEQNKPSNTSFLDG
jgi:hypothetical protein